MVRKIFAQISDEVLQPDLEKYRRRALALGATDARIITTDMVLIDERVRAKCIYPKCGSYGTSANCPPYAMELEMVRRVVANFQYAVFIRLEVPAAEMVGTEAMERRAWTRSQLKCHEIVSRIEAEAFYDGYHLALGFASGSCKRAFCPDAECSALIPGKGCRHPLRARSSMEAVGMNAFTMAATAGWDVYPLGRSQQPADVPCGNRLGLVLIH